MQRMRSQSRAASKALRASEALGLFLGVLGGACFSLSVQGLGFRIEGLRDSGAWSLGLRVGRLSVGFCGGRGGGGRGKAWSLTAQALPKTPWIYLWAAYSALRAPMMGNDTCQARPQIPNFLNSTPLISAVAHG